MKLNPIVRRLLCFCALAAQNLCILLLATHIPIWFNSPYAADGPEGWLSMALSASPWLLLFVQLFFLPKLIGLLSDELEIIYHEVLNARRIPRVYPVTIVITLIYVIVLLLTLPEHYLLASMIHGVFSLIDMACVVVLFCAMLYFNYVEETQPIDTARHNLTDNIDCFMPVAILHQYDASTGRCCTGVLFINPKTGEHKEMFHNEVDEQKETIIQVENIRQEGAPARCVLFICLKPIITLDFLVIVCYIMYCKP